VAAKIIFVTGTDTGVGKTLLTALLLSQLRSSGCKALAMKPFCSGDREDARILHALRERELTLDEVNPFHFPEPLAPLVAARKHRRRIPLAEVLQRIKHIRKTIEHSTLETGLSTLLIEGAGGLLAPLGEGYSLMDLMRELRGEVIVVSRNQLGTINHTLLTVRFLQENWERSAPKQRFGTQERREFGIKVVMMDGGRPDLSSRSNARVLTELLAPVPVFSLPFLGQNPLKKAGFEGISKKCKITLARILV
jgi:dethiobiotin synthetase